MENSGAYLTPTHRWKGRLHRSHPSPEYYMTRPTFEILRENTEDGLEDIAFNSIHQALTFSENGEWLPFRFTHTTPSGERDVNAVVNSSLGLVAIRGRLSDFPGEGRSDSIVIFHFLCDENDPGWKSKIDKIKVTDRKMRDIGEVFNEWYGNTPSRDDPSLYGILNKTDFDTRLYKLLPTDLIVKGRREDTARYVRSEISEVRISDDPQSSSKEQSRSIDLIDFGVSPEIHVTGRPGSGKTTVATVVVAEAALQRGPRRGSRKILYITTTSELADLARREVESLVKHVYNDERGIIYDSIRRNLYIESRDSLIKDLAQEDSRLDQQSLERLIEDAELGESININLLDLKNLREEDKKKLKFLLKNPEIIRRALVNLIFGVFGSVKNYLTWYKNLGSPDDKQMFDLFCNKKINFIPRSITTGTEIFSEKEGHAFTLSDFWDPYDSFTDEKVEDIKKEGRSLIAALSMFLESDSLGGHLHRSGGSGLWTHASVLNAINESYKQEEEMFSKERHDRWPGVSKSSIWSEENINDFDAIIFDESQDFTPREISIILERFSNRADNSRGRLNTRKSHPFLFFSSGDPLQTIEGNIFDPRNQHIRAIISDWRDGLEENSGRIKLTRGMGKPIRQDLSSNYRNALPIVENAVNPLIGELRKTSVRMGKKRTIGDQSAASSRRGMVIRIGEEEEGKATNQVQLALIEQLSKQIAMAAEDHESLPDPSVVLILPMDNLEDRQEVESTIPDEFSQLREALQLLWSSPKFELLVSRGDAKSIDRMNSKAGICSVSSIKGLTVPAAIAIGFSTKVNQAARKENDNELIRMLSHYLVAVSRPQFVLMVHEGDEQLRSDGELVISSSTGTESGEISIDDIKRVLSRQRVNLDPSIHFDNCMSSPKEEDFWDLLAWSLNRLSSRDKADADSPWQDVSSFTNWCKEIHKHSREGEFRLGFYATTPDSPQENERISSGSKSIDREHMSSDSAREDLQKYFAWRSLLSDPSQFTDRGNFSYSPEEVLGQDEQLEPWLNLILGGIDERSVDRIIPRSDSRGALTPFERTKGDRLWALKKIKKHVFSGKQEGKEDKDRLINLQPQDSRFEISELEEEIRALEENRSDTFARMPRWEESKIAIAIPEGWFFDSGKNPMKHRNSWSTPLDLILESMKGGPINQYLRLRWFLCASRDPSRLFSCIEECFEHDSESGTDFGPNAVNWLVECFSDPGSAKLRSAFSAWQSDESKSKQLSIWFRSWLTWQPSKEIFDPAILVSKINTDTEVAGDDRPLLSIHPRSSASILRDWNSALSSDEINDYPSITTLSAHRRKQKEQSPKAFNTKHFRMMKDTFGSHPFIRGVFRYWLDSGLLVKSLEGLLVIEGHTLSGPILGRPLNPNSFLVSTSTTERVSEVFGEIAKHLPGADINSRSIRMIADLASSCSLGDDKKMTERFIQGSETICNNGPSFAMAAFWMALISTQLRRTSTSEFVSSTWFGTSLSSTWQEGEWQSGPEFPHRELESVISSISRGSDFGKPYPDFFDGQEHPHPEVFDWQGVCAGFESALSEATQDRLYSFLGQLYVDFVESGRATRMRDHPFLCLLLNIRWPHAVRKKNSPYRTELLEKTHGSDHLPHALDDLSRFWREGHNFWSRVSEPDRTKMLSSRNMTIRYEHLPEDKRNFARSKYAMVPYSSHDKPAFSASSSGLLGYVLLDGERQDLDKIHDLGMIREKFRVAGAYREAAVVGLVRAVLLARETNVSSERDGILRDAVAMAFLERPGVYLDHVGEGASWTRRNHKDMGKTLEAMLRDFRISYNKKSKAFGNSIASPIIRGKGGKPPKSLAWLDKDRVPHELMSYFEKPTDKDTLDKDGNVVRQSEKGKAAVSAMMDYEGEIHQSIRSVEQLLPYLFFSNETLHGVDLAGATWFYTQPDLELIQQKRTPNGAMEFLDKSLSPFLINPSTEGLLRDHSREDLSKSLSKDGDRWLLDLSRELVGTPEWSDDRLERFADRLLSMPKPRALRTIIADLGIRDNDSAIARGDSSDADNLASLEAVNEQLRGTLASVESWLKERGMSLDDLSSPQSDESAADPEE